MKPRRGADIASGTGSSAPVARESRIPPEVDAEEYLAGVTVSSARGEYIEPRAVKVTIAELGPEWLANRTHLKAPSSKSLEVAWRVHVEPVWGARAIGDIRYSEVQAWIRRLAPPEQASRAATKVKRAHGSSPESSTAPCATDASRATRPAA